MDAKPVGINWNSDLSIYASEAFLSAVGDEYGWLGGFDASGSMRCILPYTVVKKAFLRLVRFRVETIPLDGVLEPRKEKEFLNSAMEYLRGIGADMVIPATTNTLFRTYPDGAVAAPYGTYVLDLLQSETALWENMSASHRRKIRLAGKAGVQIRAGLEHQETAYTLVRDTFRRSGMGFMGADAFDRFLKGLAQNVLVLVAEHEGIAQGCVVVPFSLSSAYYVYGGSIPEPVAGATNLLHWEAIRTFQRLGVKRYDFVGVRIRPEEGSKQEGLMQFKERFGGQLVQGYMWKYHFRPIRSIAYSLAVRFTKGGDIVDHERHKLQVP
jgi:hypothetical protein